LVRRADAVVSAISPRPNARGLAAPSLVENARAIIAGLQRAGVKRVLFVGGAGSLEVAPGQPLVDQPSKDTITSRVQMRCFAHGKRRAK
jgi:putative NADH-flavin reductase